MHVQREVHHFAVIGSIYSKLRKVLDLLFRIIRYFFGIPIEGF